MGPDADPGEEVALGVSQKVSWNDIIDAPLVYIAGGDQVALDEFAQGGGRPGVDLVVIGPHHAPLPAAVMVATVVLMLVPLTEKLPTGRSSQCG